MKYYLVLLLIHLAVASSESNWDLMWQSRNSSARERTLETAETEAPNKPTQRDIYARGGDDRGRLITAQAVSKILIFALPAFVLQDTLYKHGYHKNPELTHAKDIVATIVADPSIATVLDVGCSHGWAVGYLWGHNKRASGIDISPTAVELARKHRIPTGTEVCVGECFTAASATAIPYAAKSFDAIMSTDVLEHIPLEDVDTMVAEFGRVAAKKAFLKIANKVEVNKKPVIKLQRLSDRFKQVSELHATVRSNYWWVKKLEKAFKMCELRVRTGTMYKSRSSRRYKYSMVYCEN